MRDPSAVVKRGERVKVKVIGLAGSRVSLSLKEVDQATGADLFPQRSAAVAAQRAEAAGGGGREVRAARRGGGGRRRN